jgi:hypothetical protein
MTGPDALKGPFDSSGFPVGCKSACLVDSNPGDSPSCCSGSHNTPATCPPSGVPFYSYFSSFLSSVNTDDKLTIGSTENNCPNSYVYAYDESSGSALWTCPSNKKADYTLVRDTLLHAS